jgi:hypothetical protein
MLAVSHVPSVIVGDLPLSGVAESCGVPASVGPSSSFEHATANKVITTPSESPVARAKLTRDVTGLNMLELQLKA